MIRTNYYMPAELLARLKKAKARTGITAAEFMRRAVERELRKVEMDSGPWRLRWTRHPVRTGLSAVGSVPRGWKLHDGQTEYGDILPNGGGWGTKQNGWYWVARVGDDCEDTRNSPVRDPNTAKRAAVNFVKAAIAKAATNE